MVWLWLYLSNENKSKNLPFARNKVVIIGLGQLGLPVAKYVKEHGFDTYGYDINQKTMQSAEANYGIKQATNFGDFDVPFGIVLSIDISAPVLASLDIFSTTDIRPSTCGVNISSGLCVDTQIISTSNSPKFVACFIP